MEEKMKRGNGSVMKLLLVICCCVILGLAVAVAVLAAELQALKQDLKNDINVPAGQSQVSETEDSQAPEQAWGDESFLLSVTERGEDVVLETVYGTVKYPAAFADVIDVLPTADDRRAALTFTASVNDTSARLYTLWFNGAVGVPVGEMVLAETGNTVQVTIEFYSEAAGLDEEALITFYAAQETVNDVIASLGDNENFVPAD